MGIRTVKGLFRFLKRNTNFSGHTVHTAILHLGFSLLDKENEFIKLSCLLVNCSNKGADAGFPGFCYSTDTVQFFIKHRKDIVKHMEQTAEDCGLDIISMVQDFGAFRNKKKPTISEVGKALWDTGKYNVELHYLYNVFAWYALEEIAHTWSRYLEDNPALAKKLSA